MTRNHFAAICIERTIDPALALENEVVRSAIPQGADAVRKALDAEF